MNSRASRATTIRLPSALQADGASETIKEVKGGGVLAVEETSAGLFSIRRLWVVGCGFEDFLGSALRLERCGVDQGEAYLVPIAGVL